MSTVLKSFREMSDEEALQRAIEIYGYYEGAKLDDLVRYERYKAMYEAQDNPEEATDKDNEGSDEEDDARFSNNKIAFGAAMVDATVNWLYNFLFPNGNYMQIDADNFEDLIAATKVTAHFQKRHKEMGFLSTIREVLIEAAIADYSITGVRWLMQPGYVVETQRTVELRDYGRAKLKYRNNRVVEKWKPDAIDRSDVFRIPYNQCYHDPDAKGGFNHSYAFCDYREETVEDFMARSESKYRPWGMYRQENVEKVLKYVKEYAKDGNFDIPRADFTSDTEPERAFRNFRLKIKRVWTKDHVLEYFNDMLIWRKNLTGWPLQRWGIFPIPNKFKMMGVLQRIERNEYDINDKLNSRQDYINLVTDPWVIFHEDMRDEGNVLYHGKVMYTSKSPRDAVYVHQPGPNPVDGALQDVKAQINFMDRVGISPEAQGAHPQGEKTATQIQTVESGTVSKVKTISRWMEDACLIPIYNQQFTLEAVMMTKEERAKYYGQSGELILGIRPEDYYWNSWPIFIARGTSEMVDEPVKIQQFMTAMDRALMAPQFHNLKNIFAEMWRIFSPKNVNKFIKDPRLDSYKVPPEEENLLFALGRRPEVSPLDDHQKHKQVHEGLKRTRDYTTWPERRKMELEAHIRAHDAASAGAGAEGGSPAQPGRSNALTASNMNEQRGIRPTSMGVTP